MEELKMIIELASKISDDAFSIVMVYFAKDLLVEMLAFSLGIVFTVIAGRLVKKAMDNAAIDSKAVKAIIKIDEMVPGTKGVYAPLIDSDIRNVVGRVSDLIKENERLKK